QFLTEYPIRTEGQRNKTYVAGYVWRLRKYIIPFMKGKGVSQVTSGVIEQYFVHRIQTWKQKIEKENEDKPVESRREVKHPARNTLHQERVAIRQVLKSAVRHGDLDRLPDMSEPYKANRKISHRAWFSPDEYKQLYKATRERVEKPLKKRFQHD